MARLEEKVDNIDTCVHQLRDDLKQFVDKADEKYAAKQVERIVYTLVGTIITFVLTAILTKTFGLW